MRLTPGFLVLMLLFAGCADGPPEPEPQAIEDPCLVQRPDDTSCLEADARNGTAAPHLHDYWGGQDRLIVIDTATHIASMNGAGPAFFRFDPDPDHVIPQGTATVEITFSWDDGPGSLYAGMGLRVKTSADQYAADLGPIENGQTFIFESDNGKNDLPHQRLSAWQFWLRADPMPVGASFRGDIALRVEAIRGIEIPLYPGHPDRWDGAQTLPLLDRGGLTALQSHSLGGNSCLLCSGGGFRPDDGAVVPHDAAAVIATLTVTPSSPTNYYLAYHGADSRTYTRLTPDEVQGDTQTYIIPVDANGDGPYALQSLWEFSPYIAEPAEDLVILAAQYTITAVAVRTL